jgi:hypothetical protein
MHLIWTFGTGNKNKAKLIRLDPIMITKGTLHGINSESSFVFKVFNITLYIQCIWYKAVTFSAKICKKLEKGMQ